MMRYDSEGYTTGIESFLNEVITQNIQSNYKTKYQKTHQPMTLIDNTSIIHNSSTSKMNFLKATGYDNSPSIETKNTNTVTPTKHTDGNTSTSGSRNYSSPTSVTQIDDISLSATTYMTQQTVETLRTEFTSLMDSKIDELKTYTKKKWQQSRNR